MRDKFSAHRCRNTFISLNIEQGASVKDLMGYLGWSNSSTLDIYLERFGKRDNIQVNKLSNLLLND